MYVISLVTQKGGCGKTTLATNLAVTAAQAGQRALILDTDPQASASQWWESRDETHAPYLIEAGSSEFEQATALAEEHGYTVVFIDTPARAEPVNAAAARVADFCLIPCQPTMADMRAQQVTVQTLKRLQKRGAFVLTRVPPRGPRVREAIRGLEVLGLPVTPVTIVNRHAYADAYASGLGVTEYEPHGKAADEILRLWRWLDKKGGATL